MSGVRTRILRAQRALLNGSGKLSYFERRGLGERVVKEAWIGIEHGSLLYPCIAKGGGMLGIHRKSERRDAKGKRRQWWSDYSADRSALEEAKDFLRDALEAGPRGATAVKKEARETDISEMTLKRAKKALGVTSEKEADGSWTWQLPDGKGISSDGTSHDDPLESLEPLPVTESLSKKQGDQGVRPRIDERFGSAGNGRGDGEEAPPPRAPMGSRD